MKKALFILGLSTLALTTGCKKIGCTDPTALNYSTEAGKDDGSCILPTEVELLTTQIIFIENFTANFSPSSSSDYDYMSFNKEPGDIVIVEALTDYVSGTSYWTAMPVSLQANAILWAEYSNNTGSVWTYADYLSDGTPVNFTGNYSVSCRAALIKGTALAENPDLANYTIDELENIDM